MMSFSLAEEFPGDLDEIKKDIVTVHGICSSRKEPWLETESKSKWIERDLFERSNARVVVFGYSIENQRSGAIDKVAEKLLECLLECRDSLDESNRPLAFISQDFGGTVVKAALTIASQNSEKYGNIVNSTFALVFLGCPHRQENRMSLVDSITILLSRTQAITGQGLVDTASSIASTIIEVNELFVESCMLYRTRIFNVVSGLPDSNSRVLAKAVSTMDWSLETYVAPYTDHGSLLCGETRKDYFDVVRGFLHFDDDSLYPYGDFPVGLNYMISQLPTVPLQVSAPGLHHDVLSRLDGLSGWIKGQGPSLLHIEHPLDQQLPLHTIVRLSESQPESIRETTRMFTFEFRAGDYRSDNILAALTVLVVQAVCFILPRYPNANLPERLVKLMKGPRPISEVFALFEAVNIFFAKQNIQALWVLWNIDQSSDDVAALASQLRDCCKFSEVRPHILLAGVANQKISLAMRQFNIESIVLGPSDFEAGATLDVKTLIAQYPHLIPHEDTIESILHRFSQDPKMFKVMFRSIQKLYDSENLNQISYEPDHPEVVFKMLHVSFSGGERRQTARLLRWIDSSFRSLTISEATIVISLELFLEMGSKVPWRSLAAVLFSNARKQVERVEENLCGVITLNNNEVGFSHPKIRRLTLEAGWYSSGVEAHLRILNLLLYFLRIEANPLEHEGAAVWKACHFRHYAAHYWPEHYRVVSQDDITKLQADVHVKSFLANDCAVQYTLTLGDGSICSEGVQTAASRRVALLARQGFDINDIIYLTDCLDVLGDSDLLFAALIGAVSGSSLSLVEQIPVTPLLDRFRAEKVFSKASMCVSPDFMGLLFERLSPTLGIKIPIPFLQKAAKLGVQAILNNVAKHPGRLEEEDMGLLLKECILSGHTEISKRLVEGGSFKGSDLDNLLNSVLKEACQNGDPGTIRSVLANFPGSYDFTWWSHLTTACESGNHEAVKQILRSIDNITSDMLVENHDALKIAVEEGFAECAMAILERFDMEDPNVKQILCDALLLGVNNDQSGTCRLLLERCPDIMNNPATPGLSLKAAVIGGNLELVNLLVDHGSPIDANLDKATALYYASQNGHAAIVEYLLRKGADVNERMEESEATPLYAACRSNKPGAVRVLLKFGADPRLAMSVPMYANWSPLEAAYDNPTIIQMLVNHSPRPDFKRRSESGGGHVTALFLAARYNSPESLRLLLQGDADIHFEREEDSYSDQCFTALTAAVSYGSSNTIVRMLLEHGANVNHIEKKSGLHLLARVGDEKILTTILEYNPSLKGLDMGLNEVCYTPNISSTNCARRLINAGASVEAIDTRDSARDTPLTNACRNANVELIELLIERGASVNGISACNEGWPLHIACWYNGLDAVKLLVDKYSADVHRYHEFWGLPLQACCWSELEQTSKIDFLVQRGADVNAKGSVLCTILTDACFRADGSAIRYLIDHGAEVSTVGAVGYPPVFGACFRGTSSQEIVQMLMSSGADVSAAVRDRTGRTTLHCAVLSGDLDLVSCLIAADPSLIFTEDYDGWTPIHWAIRSAHELSRFEDPEADTGEKQAVMIRLLVDKHCPGIDSTVKIGSDFEWTAIRIAKYFGAPKAVHDVLIELMQTSEQLEEGDATNRQKARVGLQKPGWCDGCLCDIRGKKFQCQEPSCWNNFLLCIKCIQYKADIHPFLDHNFVEVVEEGDEFEEVCTE